MKIRSLTVIVTCLLLSSPLIGQKPTAKNRYPQTGPVVVTVNLLAQDDKGGYTHELKPTDITLLENGVEQKITSLKKKVPPTKVGMVVDNSGTMRFLTPVLTAFAKGLVANLGEKDEAFVVRFVSSDKIKILHDLTNAKADLIKAIESMYIEGGRTALIDALTVAADKVVDEEEKTPDNRFAIVVLSDGEDVASRQELNHLLGTIDDSEVQIFPVFFTSGLDEGYFSDGRRTYALSNAIRLGQVLALRTGGSATILRKEPDDEQLNEALRALVFEIRSQYVIEYTSTNQKRDGKVRSLTVELKDGPNGEKRRGHIRGSFTVPKD